MHIGNFTTVYSIARRIRATSNNREIIAVFFNNSYLERRQTHAVDFSIEVEGIDVGHTRYIIDDGLNFTVQRGGMYFVLFGHFVQQ